MAKKFVDVTGLHNVFDASGVQLNTSTIKESARNEADDYSILFITATTEDNAYGYPTGSKWIWTRGELYDCNSGTIIPITYAQLKRLRDNSKLIPGQQYQITDYIFTTKQKYTKSANHLFDIVVMAESTNVLKEICHAAHHTEDTYFKDCALSSWIIKYDLNNDTTKYAWADSTNGRGVIYYMEDEHGNVAGYDFKNTLFIPNLVDKSKIDSASNCYNIVRDTSNCNMSGVMKVQSDSRTDYYYTFSNLDGTKDLSITLKSIRECKVMPSTYSTNISQNVLSSDGIFKIPYSLISIPEGSEAINVTMDYNCTNVVVQAGTNFFTEQPTIMRDIIFGQMCYKCFLYNSTSSDTGWKNIHFNGQIDTTILNGYEMRDVEIGTNSCNIVLNSRIKNIRILGSIGSLFIFGYYARSVTLNGDRFYFVPGAVVTSTSSINFTNIDKSGMIIETDIAGSDLFVTTLYMYGLTLDNPDGNSYLVIDAGKNATCTSSCATRGVYVGPGQYGTSSTWLHVTPNNLTAAESYKQEYLKSNSITHLL